jgi:hypothetical protein
MPNWTPASSYVDTLKHVVRELTERRAALMEAEYPLTREQVIAVVTPPRFREFVDLGFDSMSKTYRISYELGPEQGLKRRSITRVNLGTSVYYAYERQIRGHYQEKELIYFNRDGIDDATMARLIDWTNRAVYERRLALLTVTTVTNFFQYARIEGDLTMYHIMARWPALKVVFPAVTKYQASYYRSHDMWERHSNEVPRDLSRWDWPSFGPERDWFEKYKKHMEAAEENLMSCITLPKPDSSSSRHLLTATLTDWQKLDGAKI